eukprot:CAMPEP_0172533350 /NCGR_PEP_ID=MMETSP1067-20121228/6083_1 /TAXON_ID=265564 ORGANISM="Thalassiosira punctigera, Strain Tpunct2005C2" /NCGR_SAMPLE_ID=MMETSP1067 /ASSEMBLY_ACC=CAM_ASM_000444 /LENGTH=1015 /DNA_ID=CAMNT_0013317979 /DNA_START=86 /DNA_END=3133 /DNA_ORIENTATION=+
METQTADERNIGASSMQVAVAAKRRERQIGFGCAATPKNAMIGLTAIIFLLVSRALEPRRSHHIVERTNDVTGSELRSVNTDSPIGFESTTSRPQHRRSLSMFKRNRCQSTPQFKQQPQSPIPLTYLATYPGSGSRITRQLIKALTGLRVLSANDQIQKNNIVAIQTQYPHEAGNLVERDNDIHRTVILIRNPMYALPTLFDELYASKKHLPARFHPKQPVAVEEAATVAEWVSWRDRLFENQMKSYEEFIRYWIKRYGHKKRLILSYEDLIDDATGSEEATRLATFLGEPKEVSTLKLDDVPCVWLKIFKDGVIDDDDGNEDNVSIDEKLRGRRQMLSNNEVNASTKWQSKKVGKGSDPDERRKHRRLASYFIPHPNSINAAPSARPFTREQLKAMISSLHQLSDELHPHSHHLQRVLVRYRDEIIEILKQQDVHNTEPEGRAIPQSGVPPTRPFHIFHVSPPGIDSPLITNWLIGLFEPEAKFTKLVTSPGLGVSQDGKDVPITTTIVTHTNEMNLIGLYKIFKPGFDEVFFVLSKSGTDADQQVSEGVCEYDNVLCIEFEEQIYNSKDELQAMVHHLTEKFQRRFGNFFGSIGNPVGSEESVISRLKGVVSAIESMANEPYESVDPKFGVHGGLEDKINSQRIDVDDPKLSPRRLFYCGSSGSANNRNFSTLGIFLANAFFPEIVGDLPQNGDTGTDKAIPLTLSSINDATPNDFLVFMQHQYCEVDVLAFPGLQLHINHPAHGFSAFGKYTPQGDKIFVIGPHEEGPHSIKLPYAVMKWWVVVKGLGSHGKIDRPTMRKFFVPSERPKNTGKHFLLYVNSHYADHREMAAFALSQLGPMHALGSCQGNVDAAPVVDVSRPPRCQPFTDDKRPPSIIVPNDMNRKSNYFTDRLTFQDFRFMLLMEDYNIPGYITERIVDGFMAGTIPIYYGTTEVFDIFNPKAFIYYDIRNPQEALERIRYLEDNPDAYQQMLNEPILANAEHTIETYFSFDDSIGNGMLKKRVRSKLGFPV